MRIALFVVVALAVAVTANLVLLGIATGPKDPVGTLSPRAGLVRLPAPTTTVLPLPTTTVTTTPAVTTQPPPSTTTSRPDGEGSRGSRQDD